MDGVYGMQVVGGAYVTAGSHECGKNTCKLPATIAVFGKATATGLQLARINVCPGHVEAAMRELVDAWFCALLRDRDVCDYCPHCGAVRVQPNGHGHHRICPVGATFRPPHPPHPLSECDVCSSYHERRPGPTG